MYYQIPVISAEFVTVFNFAEDWQMKVLALDVLTEILESFLNNKYLAR